MTRPVRMILIVLAALFCGWLLYSAVQKMYLTPRAEKLAYIENRIERIEKMELSIDRGVQVRRDLDDYVARTLGGDLQTVDHELRSRLNRIVEELSLQDAVVSTAGSAQRSSPARRKFGRSKLERELRDEIDFVEVEGSVVGRGSLRQVLQLIDRVEAEPWTKRIHTVQVDPKRGGESFSITLRLTTLFLPGESPEELPEQSYDPSQFDRYAMLAEANPFVLPAPATVETEPVEVAADTKPAPEPEPEFPYGRWSMTGIAESPIGTEVWLLDKEAKESRRLGVGDFIGNATLVDARGEQARFRIGERQFMVRVGESLGDRTPPPQ